MVGINHVSGMFISYLFQAIPRYRFVKMIEGLKDKHTKNLADFVMQISVTENKGLYNRLLEEDPGMCLSLIHI